MSTATLVGFSAAATTSSPFLSRGTRSPRGRRPGRDRRCADPWSTMCTREPGIFDVELGAYGEVGGAEQKLDQFRPQVRDATRHPNWNVSGAKRKTRTDCYPFATQLGSIGQDRAGRRIVPRTVFLGLSRRDRTAGDGSGPPRPNFKTGAFDQLENLSSTIMSSYSDTAIWVVPRS
jgi:hypothetical protein